MYDSKNIHLTYNNTKCVKLNTINYGQNKEVVIEFNNENPDYSCPFRLKVKNKPPFVSGVWQNLWGIKDNPLESTPSFLSENINQDKFPLLSELQRELQNN